MSSWVCNKISNKYHYHPSISVILCIYNPRLRYLKRCLKALWEQNYPTDRYELIILDNNPSNLLVQLIDDLNKERKIDAKYFKIEGRVCIPVARAMGIRIAQRSLIAFTDDDCVPKENWLTAFALAFTDQSLVGAGGLVLSASVVNFMERFSDFDRALALPKMNHKGVITTLIGANCCYRTQHIKGIDFKLDNYQNLASCGLFPGFDDYLMSQEIIKKGYRLAYVPEAIVYHHHPNTIWKKLRQYHFYGSSAITYCSIFGASPESLDGEFKIPNKSTLFRLCLELFKGLAKLRKKYATILLQQRPLIEKLFFPLICPMLQLGFYVGVFRTEKRLSRIQNISKKDVVL